ncbi:hypothetical protein OIU79_011127 [Salix purpurea]|uniref:Uncharacterized protein n=1 Tax=Salix purpurea TaxID=77065 RepID=A0A9Q0QH87_SALPP|nr:hypothetical protein OIU79_011127 [Salix purpurea]
MFNFLQRVWMLICFTMPREGKLGVAETHLNRLFQVLAWTSDVIALV